MKRTEAEQIGEIIHNVFARAGLAANEARQRACAMWPDAVGSGVNSYTTRRYVTDAGVMHVYLSSASLKNDLMFMRDRIVRQLNEYVGSQAITDLIIH